MHRAYHYLAAGLLAALCLTLSGGPGASFAQEDDNQQYTRNQISGLKRFQFLVGDWRASSRTRNRVGGVETLTWKWHLERNEPPALLMDVDEGTYFESALLRYDPDRESYRFVGKRIVDDEKKKTETVVYEGKLEASDIDSTVSVITMSRRIPGSPARERVILKLSDKHHYVFQLEYRPNREIAFTPRRVFSVTREGKSIAALKEASQGPECFISGGLGTSSYTYKGKTYYFCCSGCLESFKDDPERWIAEAEKAKKKE